MCYVSSRSGVATLRTAIHLYVIWVCLHWRNNVVGKSGGPSSSQKKELGPKLFSRYSEIWDIIIIIYFAQIN